jgi:uncharacterized protein YndB with AHSA1/START domain
MKTKLIVNSLVLALICLAGPAPADSATRSVETTKHMPVSPDRVIEAFLDAEELASWWKVSRSLTERKQGGIWSVAWDDWGADETQHAWIGVIDEVTADKLVIGHLVMLEPDMPLLGPMQLEIRVESAEGGSIVSVSHRGYGYGDHWDSFYQEVVAGWDHVLGDLQAWFDEVY